MQALSDNPISFSEEQAMLLESATEFCKKHSDSATVRARLAKQGDQQALEDDRQLWREMTQLGWSGLAVPEAFGGSGIGIGAAAAIAEPMGRRLVASPFITTQMVIQALLAGATDQQQKTWLPKLAQGSAATVAVVEGDGDWNLYAAQTRLVDHQLQGQKTLVGELYCCDLVLVTTGVDDDLAIVLLDRSVLGADRVHSDQVLDETRRSYSIDLTGLRVDSGALITGASAQAAITALEQTAWLLYSADACGGVSGVIDLVVDYLNTRTQFGHKIGSYQSLKHPTVDMLMGLERARSHLYHAATLLDAGAPAEVALRMAKAESTDAYTFAGDRAIQFHGGFGFTYECDAQMYLRRALWLQYQYGDAPHHRAELAHQLLA